MATDILARGLALNAGGTADKALTMAEALSNLGRFLSIWNCTTGLPETNPPELDYEYKSGDYYIIGAIATEDFETNYRPDGSSYTGQASTQVELTDNIAITDMYYYDGTSWSLLTSSAAFDAAVTSVNGQIGDVVLDAEDIGIEFTEVSEIDISQSVNEDSTTDEIPSAKAVYNYGQSLTPPVTSVNEKTGDVVLTAEDLDIEYPVTSVNEKTGDVVLDAEDIGLELAEVDSAAIVTEIDEDSTDSQIPTAKAVYDLAGGGGGGESPYYEPGDSFEYTGDSNTESDYAVPGLPVFGYVQSTSLVYLIMILPKRIGPNVKGITWSQISGEPPVVYLYNTAGRISYSKTLRSFTTVELKRRSDGSLSISLNGQFDVTPEAFTPVNGLLSLGWTPANKIRFNFT